MSSSPNDLDEARTHAAACLAKPGGRVVVEEYLDGPEASVFCVTDGTTVLALPPAQDFKRVGDGDEGPNTGGMGAYSPLDWAPADLADLVVERIAQPTIDEMRHRGTPFVGALYVGLALTSKGPRVVEFNARFGDPDGQVSLAKLRTPLGTLLHAAAAGRLEEIDHLRIDPAYAVNVVVASTGYPAAPRTGDPIAGVESAETVARRLRPPRRHGPGRRRAPRLRRRSGPRRRGHRCDPRGGARRRIPGRRGDPARRRPPPHRHRPRGATWRGHHRMSAPTLPGYTHVYSGKVRDLYAPDDAPDQLLLVASDRISAFDYVLDTPIPDKGAVLTQLSLWWFDRLSDVVPNHLVSTDVPAEVAGRAVLCRRLEMVPVECIARAYLTGGGLSEYAEKGSVSGVPLPPGLVDGDRLTEPVFTPTTKAPVGEHDLPMTAAEVAELVGADIGDLADGLTRRILARGNEIATERGIIIADTKVEFGVERTDGKPSLILADEVLTPDSSRFWPAEEWEPGHPQPSFDKQYVRDWLTSPASGWDRRSGEAPPPLPEDVIERTRAKYVDAYQRLTGRRFG